MKIIRYNIVFLVLCYLFISCSAHADRPSCYPKFSREQVLCAIKHGEVTIASHTWLVTVVKRKKGLVLDESKVERQEGNVDLEGNGYLADYNLLAKMDEWTVEIDHDSHNVEKGTPFIWARYSIKLGKKTIGAFTITPKSDNDDDGFDVVKE